MSVGLVRHENSMIRFYSTWLIFPSSLKIISRIDCMWKKLLSLRHFQKPKPRWFRVPTYPSLSLYVWVALSTFVRATAYLINSSRFEWKDHGVGAGEQWHLWSGSTPMGEQWRFHDRNDRDSQWGTCPWHLFDSLSREISQLWYYWKSTSW